MNDSNTHLSIKHNNIKWVFTGSYGQCHFGCTSDDYLPILCYGYIPNENDKSLNFKDTWFYACIKHLPEITCKKQYCNYCNKKSIIKEQPIICNDCADKIIENCITMTDVCKYPVISREECKCIYCTKQTRK
jgi:hypothetical protein